VNLGASGVVWSQAVLAAEGKVCDAVDSAGRGSSHSLIKTTPSSSVRRRRRLRAGVGPLDREGNRVGPRRQSSAGAIMARGRLAVRRAADTMVDTPSHRVRMEHAHLATFIRDRPALSYGTGSRAERGRRHIHHSTTWPKCLVRTPDPPPGAAVPNCVTKTTRFHPRTPAAERESRTLIWPGLNTN